MERKTCKCTFCRPSLLCSHPNPTSPPSGRRACAVAAASRAGGQYLPYFDDG
ncbi:MAG TPA: hypothetical protein IAC22_01865 [Candidatus Caccocola faecipullorum]|nr:hypothetical protein [Candidatus Caccocola faecipullorum]